MTNTYEQDALPVAITGIPGSQVSLLDVLTQAYGDQVGSISNVRIGYWGSEYLEAHNFSYWDPAHPYLTTVVGDNVTASTPKSGFTSVDVPSTDFANVMIDVGNNIMPNITIQVPTFTDSTGNTNYQELNVTVVQSQLVEPATALDSALDATAPHVPSILNAGGGLSVRPGIDGLAPSIFSAGFSPSHIPTAADVVAAAEQVAKFETGVPNGNDCHFIAMDIAAAAGAPLDPNTQSLTPSDNEDGGYWRIAFAGSSVSSVSDWQTLVRPRDIVRLAWLPTDPHDANGPHTLTVIQGLGADPNNPNAIQVVDNAGGVISEHWLDYNSLSNTASVTIYRLTTDGLNLIDEIKDTSPGTFLGTEKNDLMQAGSGGNTLLGGDGNDTLVGGKGNDTLDGGSGDNTAVFTGKESDYHFTFNADGSVTVADQRTGSNDGTDTLKNIQHLHFADGTFAPSLIKTIADVNHWSVEDTNNTFVGGDGNDTLVGGQGNDTLDGGAGIDKAVFTGKESDYLITFNADGSVTVADQRFGWDVTTTPDGTDTLKNIEQIQFADKTVNVSDLKAYTDAGHSSVMVGGSDYDISATHGGNVVIVGNGAAHFMTGSAGNDVFYVDNAQQVVFENVGNGDLGGVDEVRTTLASYALPDPNEPGILNHGKIENLTFVGTGDFHGTGNSLDNVITGGAGDDVLTGGAGNDTIDGGGGVNTAVFSGNQSDYKITVVNGITTITDLRAGSPDGTDTLKNIELLKFADGVKHFSLSDYTTGSVAISDATITEGNNGSQLETFTLTRTGGSAAFDVNFATTDGTATTADGDYVTKSGTVHIADGVNTQSVSVVVNGDTRVEANETYNVNLSGATNGATISHAQGVGTIVNDDASGSVSIGDATITEGNNGSQIETFTVTRTGGNAAFDVNFATADGTATTADGDYVQQHGPLHFAAGVNTQTISVVVNGDTKVEVNETYNVNLSGATNGATISHATGVGTIVNDDTAPTPTSHAANDFNGDGISDVLFGNNSGKLALWELNGNHIASNTTVGSIPAGWHLDGVGDFNGDGKSDILLHSDSGQVAMWQMNGDHIASNTTVGSISSDWHVAEIADFSGDGKADMLWENSKGQVAMWQMNGNHIASNTTVGSVGTDWHAIGTGDFNGDGKADVLWENSKGQVAMWQMNGDHIASNTTVGSVGTDWKVAGVGDFNGDGKADVLWENAKGQVAMWQMNGDHIASNTTVGSAPGWTVIGTGDYNHDGKADVLLQNASGTVAEWQMNGDHIAHNLTVGSHSTDWHMV